MYNREGSKGTYAFRLLRCPRFRVGLDTTDYSMVSLRCYKVGALLWLWHCREEADCMCPKATAKINRGLEPKEDGGMFLHPDSSLRFLGA